jgi:hypothetical protein
MARRRKTLPQKAAKLADKRPNEVGTGVLGGIAVALVAALKIGPEWAAVLMAVVAALPAGITYARNRGWV